MAVDPAQAAAFGPLVTGHWLAAHLDEVQPVDVRWYLDGRSGREAYLAGHIPGAVWLDIDADLSGPPSPEAGRHPLPSPEHFAAALAAMGIADGTPVVAYDDASGSVAARLWWLLHVLDEPVAVLDGGIAGWPGQRSTDVPAPAPAQRTVRAWPAERFVSAEQVADTTAAIFDARSAERFAGDAGIDPRPGHIPGARSAPWSGNLDDQGRFRPPDDLRSRFGGDLGGDLRGDLGGGAIAYCGSGVTACHDLLAMTLAGMSNLALYPGSWSQWGADPARPAETGPGEAG